MAKTVLPPTFNQAEALKRQNALAQCYAQQAYNSAYQQQSDLAKCQQMQNAYSPLASLAGLASMYGGIGAYQPGAGNEQSTTTTSNHVGVGSGGGSKGANKRAAKEADTERKWREIFDGPRRKNPRPKLSLKSTPLFGHLRWRFDSPFAPLRRWFARWVLSWRYVG